MALSPSSRLDDNPLSASPAAPSAITDDLAGINAELSGLMNCSPAELRSGAERSLSDELIVCGILGGKDVGKSTLINVLAGRPVSRTHEEVGAGTTRPMAYVHRDSVAAYKQRFDTDGGLSNMLDVTPHDADAIRNVVLVDMPDFDSDLPRHRETVQVVAPLLDRLIWVVTPRKIADRTWTELLSTVIKHHNNVHCVLNKADELLGDDVYREGLPRSFVDDQLAWADGVLRQAGFPLERAHLFIAAADAPTGEEFARHIARRWDDPGWTAYPNDRPAVAAIGRQLAEELNRLRGCVLSPLRRSEADAVKQANRQAEVRRNVEIIRRHFELEEWNRELNRACQSDYQLALFDEAFGADFCAVVARRLHTGQRSETELADDLLVDRVEQWPILPVVFWPLRWLVRRLGARFAGARWAPRDVSEGALTVHGQTLTDRLRVCRSRLDADHAQAIRRFGLAAQLPAAESLARRVESSTASLVDELDEEVLTSLNQTYRRPAVWKRWLLWAILIWFPFAQPLAEGLLRMSGAGGKIDISGGLLQLVTALGARHLLTSLVLVSLSYVVLLAVMYARCVGQVRKARRGRHGDPEAGDGRQLMERLEELMLTEIVGGLSGPFADAARRLGELSQRLGRY